MKKFTQWVDTIRQAEMNEASELQKSYQDYFKKKLDKFGAKSPAELSEDDKKKFFNEISTEWEKGKGLKDGVKEGIVFEAAKTTDKDAEKLVKSIIKSNPRFKWLHDDLPNNYTLVDVKQTLNDAGYGQEYDKHVKEGIVFEAEIKSAEEFKKFAMDKLKKVHGDDFDEAKAEEVIKGLSDEAEKSGDWGAAVGKLNKA